MHKRKGPMGLGPTALQVDETRRDSQEALARFIKKALML